jgi:hypothetical protein
MSEALRHIYGSLFIVRPPAPVTLNKAGANYKSEVGHLEYSPRGAYDEWLAICEGILSFGGDALFDFEADDDALLDKGSLTIDARGEIRPEGAAESIGNVEHVNTGRVFAANGPWVIAEDGALRVLMPNMLAHRQQEGPYYQSLLEHLAEDAHLELSTLRNPHRWEGMADVAAVGDRAVLTYTVEGHYDEGLAQKTMRSSRKGVETAAEFAEIDKAACVLAELVYPHFHGDTVHFCARPKTGSPVLVHYKGGLWRNEESKVRRALGDEAIVPIDRDDAVDKYAGNSRQVERGVLVPDGVSESFIQKIEGLGLSTLRVPLFELFGKAGGGPACATLYLPSNLSVSSTSRLRYGVRRDEARARRERIAEKLTVDAEFFKGKTRG